MIRNNAIYYNLNSGPNLELIACKDKGKGKILIQSEWLL